MAQPQVNAIQLQRRDPAAWTALLQMQPERGDDIVTAVQARLLYSGDSDGEVIRVVRYQLMLVGHSDPITFIGKQTNRTEVDFYRKVAPQLGSLTPHCLFADELSDHTGWLILADVSNHYPPLQWTAIDTESVLHAICGQHIRFHNQPQPLQDAGLAHFLGSKTYTWDELRADKSVYFEEGPAAVISDHAIASAGELAPIFLQAANGLTVMRSLGGWPGILGESHLAAAADLLDDPLPILEPLKNLPVTLLHGNQHAHHWRITFFDDHHLIDWRKACIGPGICDVVNLLEQYNLLYEPGEEFPIRIRTDQPLSEETMLDTYLIQMHQLLGSTYSMRDFRLAVPAARCLYVLTNWFPLFATWFTDMPSKYTWQKINRMTDAQLAGSPYQGYARFRPYLSEVFARFLRAYHML